MNSLHSRARQLASVAVLSGAAFFNAYAATDAQPIDKVENATRFADCMFSAMKKAFKDSSSNPNEQNKPIDPNAVMKLALTEIRTCAAEASGLSLDQVPELPDLTALPENMTEADMEAFEAKSRAFKEFMNKYVDEKVYSQKLLSRFPELMNELLENEMKKEGAGNAPAPQ